MVFNFNELSKDKKREPFEFITRSGEKFTLKNMNDLPKSVWIDEDSDVGFLYEVLSNAMSEKDYERFEKDDMSIGDLNIVMEEWMKHSGIDQKKLRRRLR